MWLTSLPQRLKWDCRRSRANSPRCLTAYRLQLEFLEPRLPLGDALLGAALSSFVLDSSLPLHEVGSAESESWLGSAPETVRPSAPLPTGVSLCGNETESRAESARNLITSPCVEAEFGHEGGDDLGDLLAMASPGMLRADDQGAPPKRSSLATD